MRLNDAFRTDLRGPLASLASLHLVITRGVAERGMDFAARALEAVRTFDDFAPENDPFGEHDSGAFKLDDETLFWKIEYYDEELENGSPDPADANVTMRVLTIMFADEY
jgi:Protein of unknown function (DUF3768)